ncbi:MAG: hypothetical protein ACRDEA_03265 [Microcystaceae cyanobacterium]
MTETSLNHLVNLRTLSRIPDERKKSLVEQQFNLLITQSILGLPIEKLLDNYPQFKDWLPQIREAAPKIWTVPEHQKVTNFPINYPHLGYLLRTTYDLLVADSENAQIHYWTTANPVSLEQLNRDWHTQLDLFLLVQSLQYNPEKVSLTYWFLTQFKVVKVTIFYDGDLHKQFQENLSQILQQKLLPPQLEEDLTTRFLKGEISATDYVDAIPEVEI